MTPCENLGYKEGDKFIVLEDDSNYFLEGEEVILIDDDLSACPKFKSISFEDKEGFLKLSEVIKCKRSENSDLLSTFKNFSNKVGESFGAELLVSKDQFTLFFGDYEFKGNEARMNEVMELLLKLHKGNNE